MAGTKFKFTITIFKFSSISVFLRMFVAYLLLRLKLGLLKTIIIIIIINNNKICCWLHVWLRWSCDNCTISRNIFTFVSRTISTFIVFEGILNHLRYVDTKSIQNPKKFNFGNIVERHLWTKNPQLLLFTLNSICPYLCSDMSTHTTQFWKSKNIVRALKFGSLCIFCPLMTTWKCSR